MMMMMMTMTTKDRNSATWLLLLVLATASAVSALQPNSRHAAWGVSRKESCATHPLLALQQQDHEIQTDVTRPKQDDDDLAASVWADYQEQLVGQANGVSRGLAGVAPPQAAVPTTTTTTTTTDDSNNLLWKGVVVLLCALWASNFAAIKLVVAEPGVDSSLYAVARFGLATLSLLPFCIKQLTGDGETSSTSTTITTTTTVPEELGNSDTTASSGMDAETLQGAIVCGSWVAFGYIGQLLGLLTTTASKSCVICSLHCVFVAAMAEFWRSRSSNEASPYNVQVLLPAALAVVGVSIVELWGTHASANVGDLLSFCQPIGFGMGYLQLEHLMAKRPDLALPVSAIKLAMVTLASLLYFELSPWMSTGGAAMVDGTASLLFRLPDFAPIWHSPTALAGVVYTGLVTTALALWIESIAFSRVSATTASLILTTEPLFAAGFGALALGETFGESDYVGATCIIGACVLATLMDTPGGLGVDEECIPIYESRNDDDDDSEPVRRWPFGGF